MIEVPHVDFRIHQDVRDFDSPHMLFFSKESLGGILADAGYEVIFLATCAAEYGTAVSAGQRSSPIADFTKAFFGRALGMQAIAVKL